MTATNQKPEIKALPPATTETKPEVKVEAKPVTQQPLPKVEEVVKVPELKPLLRTPKGCFKLHKSKAWGTWYRQVDDPKGVDIDPLVVKRFYLAEDFPKVPLKLVRQIVSFYRHYITNLAPNSTVDTDEVQVLLLRKEPDYLEWKVTVPEQVITTVTVDSTTKKGCDISTGEEYEVFPPEGYAHAGSSHSHNTMNAFFSSRDDSGELKVPGLHFVIGRITKESYDIKASVVFNRLRYVFHVDQLIDLEGVTFEREATGVAKITDSVFEAFHENVHKFVSKPAPKVYKSTVWPLDRNPLAPGFQQQGAGFYRGPGKKNYQTGGVWESRKTRKRNKNHAYSWTPGQAKEEDTDDFPMYDAEKARKIELRSLIAQIESIVDRGLEEEMLVLLGVKRSLPLHIVREYVVGDVDDILHEFADCLED